MKPRYFLAYLLASLVIANPLCAEDSGENTPASAAAPTKMVDSNEYDAGENIIKEEDISAALQGLKFRSLILVQIKKPKVHKEPKHGEGKKHGEGETVVIHRPIPFQCPEFNPLNAEAAALSMQILFDKDTADLTDYAKQQLAPLAQVLKIDLPKETLIIEGHADASGECQHNQTLSEARAQAVRDFLIKEKNVNPLQVKSIGKGETDLLDIKNPISEKNRRVRFLLKKSADSGYI